MPYLYADGEPFPLESNFLKTLESAIQTASELLELDQNIVATDRSKHPATRQAAVQLKALAEMELQLRSLLAQQKHNGSNCRQTAAAIWHDARAHIAQTRERIQSWRDRACRTHRRDHIASSAIKVLERFSLNHVLPESEWAFRWLASAPQQQPQAQVYALCPGNLSLSFGVDVPPNHPWASPPRVADLGQRLHLHLRGRDWRGRGRMRIERLDNYVVTRVTSTHALESVVLAKSLAPNERAFRICFRVDDNACCTLEYLDGNGLPLAAAMPLTGIERQDAELLWRKIRTTTKNLVHARTRLLAASIDGNDLSKLTRTRAIAKAIIASITPLCSQVARRSETLTELKLKRSLGGGRREELFVDAKRLRRMYKKLDASNQRLFDSLQLERIRTPRRSKKRVPSGAKRVQHLERREVESRSASPSAPVKSAAPKPSPKRPPRTRPFPEERSKSQQTRTDGTMVATASSAQKTPSTGAPSHKRRIQRTDRPCAPSRPRQKATERPPAPSRQRRPSPPPPARPPSGRTPIADAKESYPIALVRPLRTMRPREDSNSPTLRMVASRSATRPAANAPQNAPHVSATEASIPQSERRTTKITRLAAPSPPPLPPETAAEQQHYSLPKPKRPPQKHAS